MVQMVQPALDMDLGTLGNPTLKPLCLSVPWMRFSRYAWPSESESGGQTAQVSAAVGWRIPGGNLDFLDGRISMGSIFMTF